MNPTQFANTFISHLKYLEYTRRKMELLFFKKIIVRRDIELVYGGIYLEAVTTFERFIEQLFIKLLTGKISYPPSKIFPRVLFKSDYIASAIVHGDRSYLDWFPYRYTIKRADAFFRSGSPFSVLDKNDLNNLDIMLFIRNVIAHKSRQSYKMFEENVISGLALTPREKTPLGYLRSIFAISPIQTRYEEIINNMGSIALKLCKK